MANITAAELKTDIENAVKVLELIEGLVPNGARLVTYTDLLASVVENDAVLAILVAVINSMDQAGLITHQQHH